MVMREAPAGRRSASMLTIVNGLMLTGAPRRAPGTVSSCSSRSSALISGGAATVSGRSALDGVVGAQALRERVVRAHELFADDRQIRLALDGEVTDGEADVAAQAHDVLDEIEDRRRDVVER